MYKYYTDKGEYFSDKALTANDLASQMNPSESYFEHEYVNVPYDISFTHNGVIKWRPSYDKVSVMRYKPVLTNENFLHIQEQFLNEYSFPKEFKTFLCKKAYDEGHSAGYNEVMSILTDLCYDFNQAWTKYQYNLKRV